MEKQMYYFFTECSVVLLLKLFLLKLFFNV